METIKTMAEFAVAGEQPEFLFWVGCAGSFDDRHKKVTRAFSEILQKVGISFAVLGTEESCTGDPARRAGNEFLFQMQAMANIEVLNLYAVKKIVTACPHCFNTLKNHGYNIEHNYGHGSENLCYNFYMFTLLAFTMHQIHQLTDKLFQAMRLNFGRLGSMWERIRVVIDFIYFRKFKYIFKCFLISNGLW